MATPGIGTPIIIHGNGTNVPDTVAFVVLTHDTWNSTIGSDWGISQPAADHVMYGYFNPDGSAGGNSGSLATEGTGSGQFSLLAMQVLDS